MALRKKFQAETRDCFGTNEMHRLRRGGRVPGVVYGPGEETVPISVDQHDISHLLDTITVENTLIDLSVTGSVKKDARTLIREVQRHPFKPEIQHLDFYCLAEDRPVNLDVPVVLHGTPEGVRNQGGLVQHVLRDIEILVLPSNIPEQVVVDITELEIGNSIHLEDIELGDYEVLTDLKSTVVSVIPPTVIKDEVEEGEEGEEGEEVTEADEAAAEAAEETEPEVIGRGKESEEK